VRKGPPVLALALVGSLSCREARSPTASAERAIVVVAPHPDDETLIAAGVVSAARARGERVAVVVVTNGDFTCERDGHVRQGETVAALAALGVAEEDVHFLGYPDGWLAELGDEPLPPIARRAVDGSCRKDTGTYAERGASHHDEHTARTGAAGAYDARSLEGDLTALLARLRPRDLYVTHPLDSHPDHAATYAYVRRAIDRLGASAPPPRVHRAIVHAGPCWPNGRGTTEPCPAIVTHDLGSPVPLLPDPYASYLPPERIAVPDAARKLAAIGAYRSQLGDDPDHDWLTSFARADEPFWPETLTCKDGRCASTSALPRRIALSPAAPDADVAPYHAQLDATDETLTITAGDRVLRKWTLPLAGRDRAHVFDVTIGEPGRDGAVEVTVARDGAILGIAIDPRTPSP
jgi:LmbE family N-acetylglucosaminyl deacetylase